MEKESDVSSQGNTEGTRDDIQFKYLVPPHKTSLIDILIVIFYHMLPFTSIPILLNSLYLWKGTSAFGWKFLAVYFTIAAILATVPLRYSPTVRNRLRYLYGALARYIPVARFVVPSTPFPDRQYIFAFHPHGRMFYSNSMMVQLDNLWRRPIVPKGELFIAAASGFFIVPVLRSLLYAIGAMPASRSNIIKRLRGGHHVAIVVGGIKEVCVGTSEDTDTLYLLKRKGFVKIAVEENAGLVPIYCFNENQLFRSDPKWLLNFWGKVNAHVNIGVPFMRGIFNLPMPFRRELLCAVGEPLFQKEGESIDDLHARYVEQVKTLFDRFVAYSPNPKHKLLIT